MIVINDAL